MVSSPSFAAGVAAGTGRNAARQDRRLSGMPSGMRKTCHPKGHPGCLVQVFVLPCPGSEHRSDGLVDIRPGAVRHGALGHMLDHRGDQRAGAAHPVGQDRAVDWPAVTSHHHGLPVQRHVLGTFGHGNLGQKRLDGPFAVILEPMAYAHSPLPQMRRRLGLDHARASLGADISRAHPEDHLIARRDVIQPRGRSTPIRTMSPQPRRHCRSDQWHNNGSRTMLSGLITRRARGGPSGRVRALQGARGVLV